MGTHLNGYSVCAGYSAWLVVDASIELTPDTHQCSPELAAAGGSISRTQDGAQLWSLDFSAPASLNSASTRKLHLNSHGGFSVLVDVTYDSLAADQTLFSAGHTTSGFSIVVAFDGSTKGYQFDLAKPYNSATSLSSATVTAGRHMAAFRYQSYTNELRIDSVAADGTLTTLAQVQPPLLSTSCLVTL